MYEEDATWLEDIRKKGIHLRQIVRYMQARCDYKKRDETTWINIPRNPVMLRPSDKLSVTDPVRSCAMINPIVIIPPRNHAPSMTLAVALFGSLTAIYTSHGKSTHVISGGIVSV